MAQTIREKRQAASQNFEGLAFQAAQSGQITQKSNTSVSQKVHTPPPSDSWLSSIGKSIGSLPANAGKLAVNATFTIASDLHSAFRSTGESIAELATGANRDIMRNNELRADSLSKQKDLALQEYKAGRMGKSDFIRIMQNTSDGFQELSKESKAISEWADPNQRAVDIIEVGLLAFSAGSLAKGAKVAGKSTSVMTRVSDEAYKVVQKIPVVDDLLRKRAVDLMLLSPKNIGNGKALLASVNQLGAKKLTKELATAYYLKYPLTIGEVSATTYHSLEAINNEGSVSDPLTRLAFVGLFAFKGGPIGSALRSVKEGGGKVRSLMFGTQGMFDVIGQKMGLDGNFIKYMDNLKTTDIKKYERIKESAEAMQEINLRKSGDDAGLAADTIFNYFKNERGFTSLDDFPIKSWDDLFEDMDKYYKTYEEVVLAAKSGLIEGLDRHMWKNVAVGTFDQGAKKSLIEELEKAPGIGGRVAILESIAAKGPYYTQNKLLWTDINKIIGEKNWQEKIRDIKTGRYLTETKLPKSLQKTLEENGYFVVRPQKIQQEFVERGSGRKLVSKFTNDIDNYSPAVEPVPVLKSIGSRLKKIGLSPEDTSILQYDHLTRNVAEELVDVAKNNPELAKKIASSKDASANFDDAKMVIHKLQEKASEPRILLGAEVRSEVADIRLLSSGEIASALGVTKKAGKEIKDAIAQAHLQVPLQLRGLGDRIQDVNLRFNPLARTYTRAQSAFRYAWNPFFRTQEIFETEILGQLVVGGKKIQFPGESFVRGLFGKTKPQMDNYVRKMEEAGILSGTIYGEAADDAVLGRLTAILSRSQKESLAGVAEKMGRVKYPQLAAKDALDGGARAFDAMIVNNFDEVSDALRVIVQYPRKSTLNSAMARTLNTAFFPARYNLKVTTMAAEAIAKQPAHIQLGIIDGMFNVRDWLKSDEGQIWYSENSEAIKVMSWLTPVGSIAQVLKLAGGEVESLSELGLIGGLPFGIITQMLDSQIEDFNINTPYVNPKTGDVIPDYIPKSSRARVQTALNDLIGTVFTYPGRILGLPGKGALIRDATDNFVDPRQDEFDIKTREDAITDEQRDFSETIKEFNGEKSTNPNDYQGPTLPPGPYDAEEKFQVPKIDKKRT